MEAFSVRAHSPILAGKAGRSRDIICSAESATWHARDFWHDTDAALNAGGTLLKLHDTLCAPARHDPDQDNEQRQGHRPPGHYYGTGKTRAQVAGEIAAPIAEGDCVIIVRDQPYYVPGPAAQPATARTLAAIILVWDDGTRTTALIPPAPHVAQREGGRTVARPHRDVSP